MSVFKRNHWGMGLENGSILRPEKAENKDAPVLARRLGEDALRAEGLLGRLQRQIAPNQHPLSSTEPSQTIYRDEQRHTIVLDVVRGAAAVGGKGRKNKVGDAKRSVQF